MSKCCLVIVFPFLLLYLMWFCLRIFGAVAFLGTFHPKSSLLRAVCTLRTVEYLCCRFNVRGSLRCVDRFLLMPSLLSTAKYAAGGQLFAHLPLHSDISEDTAHGRLILQNVHTVYLAQCSQGGTTTADEEPDMVRGRWLATVSTMNLTVLEFALWIWSRNQKPQSPSINIANVGHVVSALKNAEVC